VLVVDDFPPLRRALVKILTSSGMLVCDAEDGVAAAEILANDRQLEVVIADISMPKNGYTLLEHVRKHFPTIEVVMTSGYDLDHSRARELGAFGFLPKPFDVTMAVMLVERAVELRRLKLAKA
jgi:DNA-binding NtrC family response regulator